VATTLSYDLSTCQFYETKPEDTVEFNPATDF